MNNEQRLNHHIRSNPLSLSAIYNSRCKILKTTPATVGIQTGLGQYLVISESFNLCDKDYPRKHPASDGFITMNDEDVNLMVPTCPFAYIHEITDVSQYRFTLLKSNGNHLLLTNVHIIIKEKDNIFQLEYDYSMSTESFLPGSPVVMQYPESGNKYGIVGLHVQPGIARLPSPNWFEQAYPKEVFTYKRDDWLKLKLKTLKSKRWELEREIMHEKIDLKNSSRMGYYCNNKIPPSPLTTTTIQVIIMNEIIHSQVYSAVDITTRKHTFTIYCSFIRLLWYFEYELQGTFHPVDGKFIVENISFIYPISWNIHSAKQCLGYDVPTITNPYEILRRLPNDHPSLRTHALPRQHYTIAMNVLDLSIVTGRDDFDTIKTKEMEQASARLLTWEAFKFNPLVFNEKFSPHLVNDDVLKVQSWCKYLEQCSFSTCVLQPIQEDYVLNNYVLNEFRIEQQQQQGTTVYYLSWLWDIFVHDQRVMDEMLLPLMDNNNSMSWNKNNIDYYILAKNAVCHIFERWRDTIKQQDIICKELQHILELIVKNRVISVDANGDGTTALVSAFQSFVGSEHVLCMCSSSKKATTQPIIIGNDIKILVITECEHTTIDTVTRILADIFIASSSIKAAVFVFDSGIISPRDYFKCLVTEQIPLAFHPICRVETRQYLSRLYHPTLQHMIPQKWPTLITHPIIYCTVKTTHEAIPSLVNLIPFRQSFLFVLAQQQGNVISFSDEIHTAFMKKFKKRDKGVKTYEPHVMIRHDSMLNLQIGQVFFVTKCTEIPKQENPKRLKCHHVTESTTANDTYQLSFVIECGGTQAEEEKTVIVNSNESSKRLWACTMAEFDTMHDYTPNVIVLMVNAHTHIHDVRRAFKRCCKVLIIVGDCSNTLTTLAFSNNQKQEIVCDFENNALVNENGTWMRGTITTQSLHSFGDFTQNMM
jgi:hypothetical protein